MKRMIYWIKSLFLLAVIAGGSGACADDLGNYAYHDIPEIKIGGIQASIRVLAFQNLSIPVILEGLQNDSGRYEYEWLAVRQFVAEDPDSPEAEVLAVTKDLQEVISLAPGPYKLIYTVRDKQLDVFYRQQADLLVITTTSEGWVVLCSDKGNVRLDMISNVLGDTIHVRDMLAGSDMPFKKNPRALIALNPGMEALGVSPQVDPVSPFYLLTDEGATRLHREAFQWKEEYLVKYEMGTRSEVKPYHITAAGPFRMMVSDAGITDSDYSAGAGLWNSPLNYLRNGDNSKKSIRVAPYAGCNITNPMQFAPSFMFYDLDHKQFVYHPGGMYGALVGDPTIGCLEMSDTEAGGDAFTFPKGYNYVYMENSGRLFLPSPVMPEFYDNITFTILEKDGGYHLYGISLGDNYMAMMGAGYPYTKTHYADLSGCENITQASCFAFSPLNNQMFYAVGGKVYRVNLDTENPASECQFDVPGTVSCMKFYLYMNPVNSSRSFDLVVGLDKGGTEGGELRVYEAVDNLARITDYKEKYDGFPTIVDVMYKEAPQKFYD